MHGSVGESEQKEESRSIGSRGASSESLLCPHQLLTFDAVEVVDDYEVLSDRAAEVVIKQIRKKLDSVLGFATGSTPKGLTGG